MQGIQYTGEALQRVLKINEILAELEVLCRYREKVNYDLALWGEDTDRYIGKEMIGNLKIQKEQYDKRYDELTAQLKELNYI